jgi:hypothetical protein
MQEYNVAVLQGVRMKRSTGPRTTAELSHSFHRRLNAYALAASAAGVGMLALTPTAEAKIVFTRVHKTIPYNHDPLFFDVNNDGVNDFALTGRLATTTSGKLASLNVYAAHADNAVWSVQSRGHHCAAAVPTGKLIGEKREFSPNQLVMFFIDTQFDSGSNYCPWFGVRYSYLGLKIEINGKRHYGWARVNFLAHTTVLAGYAYETIPDKPIHAGWTKGATDESGQEDLNPTASLADPILQTPTATLGALALGAPGLFVWRRKESAIEGN